MTPEQITRRLAAVEAPLHDEWNLCILCTGPEGKHRFDCPWWAARAWVVEQDLAPAVDDEKAG